MVTRNKSNFLLDTWRAGKEGHPLLTQHRDLVREALEFWQEYWHRAVVSGGLHEGRIRGALDLFQHPDFNLQLLPFYLVIKDIPDEDVFRLKRAFRGFCQTRHRSKLKRSLMRYALVILPVNSFLIPCL